MAAVTLPQFAAAGVISYLGLLSGFFLASLTKEELPTGRKYFPWLQRLVIIATAVIVTNFFGFGLALKLITYAILLLLLVIKINIQLTYAVFGILLFVVASSSNTLLIVASLVFVFGLLSGSDHFAKAVKRKGNIVRDGRDLAIKNSIYGVVALTLFLLFFESGLVRVLLHLR